MTTEPLEFPKLPKWHRWSVQYDDFMRMPRVKVKIVWLGVFTVEERSGSFNDANPKITPERVRRMAIRLANSAFTGFTQGRQVSALYSAAASVERDLNSGDPKKVSDE